MKNKVRIWFTTISLLIIPTTMVSLMTTFFFIRDDKTNFYIEPFIYKNENKEVGFDHIEFEQHQIYNPKTKKQEYYLNEYGKNYLIKRFMESSIIGPEISSLKRIVISNYGIIKNSNAGKYYPLANAIYINPNSYLRSAQYNLWNKQDKNKLQEKRVELILPTLAHEYGHHLFTSYASSPIGYSKTNLMSKSHDNIQVIKINDKLKGIWNKKFYDDFKKTFFKNTKVIDEVEHRFKKRIIKYFEWLKNEDGNFSIIQAHIANKISETLYYKYFILQNKIFDNYKNVSKIFKMANENYDIQELKNKNFLIGIWIEDLEMPHIYTSNYENLQYIYSMAEQTTRKLLLSTYLLADEKSFKFKSNAFVDSLYSSNYIKFKENDDWYRFYTDNVFPSKTQKSLWPYYFKNKSQEFIEKIISPLIGHENHSNISFITTKNSWDVITNNKVIKKFQTNNSNNYKKIKFGGYIDSSNYNYIGYVENGKVIKHEISIKNFNIWYKSNLYKSDLDVKIKKQTSFYRNEGNEYYWYLKKFIDVKEIINKKLYFFQYDLNGNEIKKVQLKSIRNNDYGIANSFNSGNISDESFVKNVMVESGKGDNWLIVADELDGIQLKYYAKQEEMEKLWI